jgi:hypothetical protein
MLSTECLKTSSCCHPLKVTTDKCGSTGRLDQVCRSNPLLSVVLSPRGVAGRGVGGRIDAVVAETKTPFAENGVCF